VRHVERLGESSLVHVNLDGTTTVVARDYTDRDLTAGDATGLCIDWSQALFFDEAGDALEGRSESTEKGG